MNARPTKTDALVRDIAKLIVNYSPTVWRPVLDDLARAGGAYRDVATHLDQLLVKVADAAPRPRAVRKTAAKVPTARKANAGPAQMSLEYSPGRQRTLLSLAAALTERRLLPTAGDIRQVYLESGGKGDLPKTRKSAIQHLLRHLDGIPEESFESIHAAVQQHGSQDMIGDYQRWFQLIRKP